MRITKFKIIPQFPEDETFLLTRSIVTTATNKMTQETDENGNIISARQAPTVEPPTVTTEEVMSAIGKPSGSPANVIILETDQGPTEAGVAEMTGDMDKMRPVRIDDLLRGGVRKVDPKNLF